MEERPARLTRLSLSLQPLSVTLRVAPVVGMSSPMEMVLTGSGAPLLRCLHTSTGTHPPWTTPRTAQKVKKHTTCAVEMACSEQKTKLTHAQRSHHPSLLDSYLITSLHRMPLYSQASFYPPENHFRMFLLFFFNGFNKIPSCFFSQQNHLLFCFVYCVSMLWKDTLLYSDLETVQAVSGRLCYVEQASSFVEWHTSWWEHLPEDLENTIATHQQHVVVRWLSNSASVAVVPHRS